MATPIYTGRMGYLRGIDGAAASATGRAARPTPGHEERRRAVRSGQLAVGTVACPRCDAPVAIGERPLPASARLGCPFCAHQAPLREFLTLGAPTRPARVVVRVALRR